MCRKWNLEKVRTIIEAEGYSLISKEFKGVNYKIKLICPKGHQWETIFKSFNRGVRCLYCSGKYKKTTEKYKKEVYDLVGEDYLVLGEYEQKNKKILTKHNIDNCGYEYYVRPNDFLSGVRCPRCSGKMKVSLKEFKKRVSFLEGDSYKVLSEEISGVHTKIKMLHNIDDCGYEYYVRPGNFIHNGQRCPKCNGTPKKTLSAFKLEVERITGGEYKVIDTVYNGNKRKIKMLHNIDDCGYEYYVRPDSFLSGTRCPKCVKSKGENCILRYLTNNIIPFCAQYRFDDCRNIRPLPFDFAVFDNNKTLKCLIEYDGEQHFEAVEYFGGEEGFERCQHNDQIKNDYCAKKNIPLTRIPYWDYDNIESILETELIKLGLLNKTVS